MKTVVVAGGTGFIGSAVVEKLLKTGKYRVKVVARRPLERAARAPPYDFKALDVKNLAETIECFKGTDICIALAASIGGIRFFHKYPADIIRDNMQIAASTFEACRIASLESIVYVSSSMVYENATRWPCTEEDLTVIPPPTTAYGISKLAGERFCQAYSEQYGLKYTIIRPFNTYGVNEFPRTEVGDAHVIPDLVKKVLSNQRPLEIFGDGEQKRCFTHVSDVADGITRALENPRATNEDFNLSTDEEVKILDLAEMIFNMCRPNEEFSVKHLPAYSVDSRRRWPNTTKARRILDWRPTKDFREGLREVIEWQASLMNSKLPPVKS
jgi:nucleoside-diphosphate-sugar epimerase